MAKTGGPSPADIVRPYLKAVDQVATLAATYGEGSPSHFVIPSKGVYAAARDRIRDDLRAVPDLEPVSHGKDGRTFARGYYPPLPEGR